MDRTPVTSSTIKSACYDPDTQVLEIEFTSGGVYQYAGVGFFAHRGLMDASSKGRYFLEHIKPYYQATKVTVAP